MSAKTTTTLFVLLESSSQAVDTDSDIDQLLLSEKQLFLMHGKMVEFITFAFTCRQIKQLHRFVYEPIHLNLVTAYLDILVMVLK